MKLKDILRKNAVFPDLSSSDKKSVLEELSQLSSNIYQISADHILQVLLEREKLGSTGVGQGVAIPHGKLAGLDSIAIVFGRSKAGVDFHSHDHKPVHLFFVLLAPENAIGNHLQILARISRLLKSDHFRKKLIDIKDDQVYDLILAEDEQLDKA